MLRCAILLLVLLPGAALAQGTAAETDKTGASFVDRFATFDEARWYVSNGWSNGPHQNCTWSAANVQVANSLQLTLNDHPGADRPFTCGEIQTREFFGYGAYEVRLRATPGPGTVTAFFTYTGPPHGDGRPHDEIDFEFLGKTQRGVFLNYFVSGRSHEQAVPFDFDATATTNDYAFVWLPDSIRWFANGRLVREVKRDSGQPLPSQAQKLYLSIWNGIGANQDAWLGRFTYPGHPLVANYEYVAFTRMGEACQFPTSIVCAKPDVFGSAR
jgi:endo-1,3-1,4-beta-glycanase ExoK